MTYIGYFHDHISKGIFVIRSHNFHRQCTYWLGHVLRYRAYFRGIEMHIIFDFANIQHIVGEFLLADDCFFFSVNDEISANIITTFSHCIPDFARKSGQYTIIALKHNREFSKIHFFENEFLFLHIWFDHRFFRLYPEQCGLRRRQI